MADTSPTDRKKQDAQGGISPARHSRNGSIIPAAGATGPSLMLVIAAMCFLASLALGAALSVGTKTQEWANALDGAMTIEISPARDTTPEEQVDAVMSVLAETPGIISASPVAAADVAALLEPWLGSNIETNDLPLPRLIDIRMDPASPPDLKLLAGKVESATKGARLDTHRHWRTELTGAARAAQWLAYAVLAVVASTTIAIVIFATRAGLSANREVVEVLHLIGARDVFIAGEVQRHFLHLGLRGGLAGTVVAALAFFGIGFTGNTGDMLLVAASGLMPEHFPFLLLIPVTATLVTALTARITVFRTLENIR